MEPNSKLNNVNNKHKTHSNSNTKKMKRSEDDNLKCLYLMDYDEYKDIESILNGKEIQERIFTSHTTAKQTR